MQQSQFQNNLHAHQQQQKSPFFIEAMNNNNNITNNGFKNNDIKGKEKLKSHLPNLIALVDGENAIN